MKLRECLRKWKCSNHHLTLSKWLLDSYTFLLHNFPALGITWLSPKMCPPGHLTLILVLRNLFQKFRLCLVMVKSVYLDPLWITHYLSHEYFLLTTPCDSLLTAGYSRVQTYSETSACKKKKSASSLPAPHPRGLLAGTGCLDKKRKGERT